MKKEMLSLAFDELEIKHLINAAINGTYQIFTINNEGNYHKLDNTQLRDVISYHPKKAEIFFVKPSHRDYGSRNDTGFNELYGDIGEGQKIITDADIRKPDQPSTTKKELPQHLTRKENNKTKLIAILLYDYFKNKDKIIEHGFSSLASSYEQIAQMLDIKLSDSTIETLLREAVNQLPADKQT